MRSVSVVLAGLLVVASSAVAQPAEGRSDTTSAALQRLQQSKRQVQLLKARKRVAVLPLATPGGQDGSGLREEIGRVFREYRYEVLETADVDAKLGSHTAGTPWTEQDLRPLAESLDVETIVFGNVQELSTKRRFGVPLPTAWISTDARAALDLAVFRRTAGTVVWKDASSRRDRHFVGGAFTDKGDAKRSAGGRVIEGLLARYFDKIDGPHKR